MPLLLRIISKPEGTHLAVELKKFAEEGGSIGRAEHCDLMLPDETHLISKIHALIHFRDDMYFITDVSTNGVFVNTETLPVGKGNTKQILEGERYRIGDYIFQASFKATVEAHPDARIVAANKSSSSDIEDLLANDDDISDLLSADLSIAPARLDHIFGNDSKSVDDILAGFDSKHNNGMIDLDSLGSDPFDLNDLLPNHTQPHINVLAADDKAISTQVFDRILAHMEESNFSAAFIGHEEKAALEKCRHLLLAYKAKILSEI
jgi:type VI secretion system FHA domain protein